jgi:hypothetical protein
VIPLVKVELDKVEYIESMEDYLKFTLYRPSFTYSFDNKKPGAKTSADKFLRIHKAMSFLYQK